MAEDKWIAGVISLLIWYLWKIFRLETRKWRWTVKMVFPFQVGRSLGEPWTSVKIQGGRFGSSYKWSDFGPPKMAEHKRVTEVISYNSTYRDYNPDYNCLFSHLVEL